MKLSKRITAILLALILCVSLSVVAFADGEAAEAPAAAETAAAQQDPELQLKNVKAIAAAALLGVAATVGAIAMLVSIKGSVEGTARQPEAASNIRTTMMLGLVFVETIVIYALIIAILIIFVL